jgi:hypothetical protein
MINTRSQSPGLNNKRPKGNEHAFESKENERGRKDLKSSLVFAVQEGGNVE